MLLRSNYVLAVHIKYYCWSVHSLGLHHIPQQCHFYSVASDVRREAIFESMRHWEEKTCIRFKRRTQERDYVEITDESMQGSQW